MKKGFLILIAATLLQTAASGQITLPFSSQITNANITVASYPPGTSGAPSLQATTNLLRPIFWGAQAFTDNAGFVSVSNAFPQQFFRIGYLLPIFQFGVFYNVNLEIDPGAAMLFTDPVFCNQSIWEGSSVCTFESIVLATGTNYAQVSDPFALNFNGSGDPTFADGLPASNAPPLALYGFGTNTSPATMRNLLGLPPSAYSLGTAAAYSSNGIVYPANAADLVISNFVSGTNSGTYLPRGTNLVVYYQDLGLTQLPYDYYMVSNGLTHQVWVTNYVAPTVLGPNTNIYYAGFSWVTNAFFLDWREGWNGGSGPAKRVQAVQIDMNLLQKWLTNNATTNTQVTSGYKYDILKVLHTGNHISSAYVYNSVPLTTTTLPAVRVTNGGQLPHPGGSQRGFTVATPFPIYVWKDYNCTNNGNSGLGSTNTANTTLPAALMGDSITVLSDIWLDAYGGKLPSPVSTTVNAALITGIVPSNPNINGNYSGGLENFLRLLESWGGTLTYNGSMVALFYSQYATNSWQPTGNYFNAPNRNWAFDLNFKNASELPPLTPCVVNYVTP